MKYVFGPVPDRVTFVGSGEPTSLLDRADVEQLVPGGRL